ncbi:hypothetical protein FK513_30340, partial [Klebsiella pneumoniae]|nr:hypothetical protein [Klebsiella pneumoniae]
AIDQAIKLANQHPIETIPPFTGTQSIPKPDGDEINLPGFHNYAYSLMICQLLSSLAISYHWCTTIAFFQTHARIESLRNNIDKPAFADQFQSDI